MTRWADRGSRHARGYGAAWVKTRARILDRDSHLCQPCLATGRPTPARQVDHVTPKTKGGTDDDANLQAICDECHKAKTTQEAAEAQGRTAKRRLTFTVDGQPVWPE
jgi:5-methylcytosine-specific restriction enzyme A